MKCFFVDVEDTELEFFLFDDEVDDKMKKKLEKLGFPELSLSWPEDPKNKFSETREGIFQQGMFGCESIRLTEPTADASFSAHYLEDTNSIIVKLKGTFFSINDIMLYELENPSEIYSRQDHGFTQIIRLNNDKNKIIKKPKDEYGGATPIEALAVNTEYDSSAYKVNFRVIVKDGMYKDGEIVNDYS